MIKRNIIVVVLNILFKEIRSLKIINLNNEVQIYPKIENKITPFDVEIESESDKTIYYKLLINCDKNLLNVISNQTKLDSLCEKETDFELQALQQFLQSLSIQFNSIPKTKTLDIVYNIYYKTENAEKKHIIKQILNVVREIPTISLNSVYVFDNNLKREKMIVPVLQIEPKYSYPGFEGFDFYLIDGKTPDWLEIATEKIQKRLVFFGIIPDNIKEEFIFNYAIIDKKTDLKSILYTFEIYQISKNKKNIVYILLLVFLSFIILAAIVFGIFIYLRRQKKKNLKTNTSKETKFKSQNDLPDLNISQLPTDKIVMLNN